jgi:ABC-type phosphate/phosphonate transport system substrate-binding protein
LSGAHSRSAASEPTREATLIFGTIADNPQEARDKAGEWPAFLAFVKAHLGAVGITETRLVYCHSPGEMAEWMRDGKVDIFDESPFAAYIEARLGGTDEPILNRWKNGNEKFGSVIFASKGGGIDSLDKLKGRRLVFRGDTSTTQYFLPKAFLLDRGYKVVERQPPQPVASDEIGYYFAWTSRDQEVEDVMNGTAAAGGNSDEFINQLLGSPNHLPGIHKADLKILSTVPGVMRRLVTARSGLDPRVRVALQDLLANMHTTPEGQRVLKSFGRASRFSRVDRETAFVGIAEHSELVDQELQKWREPTGGR